MTGEQMNRERVLERSREAHRALTPNAAQLLLASIPRVYRNDAPMHKYCKTCGDKKPIEEFHRNGSYNNKPFYHTTCKSCVKRLRLALPAPVEERVATPVAVLPKEPPERTCKACGKVKPSADFHKHGTTRDGVVRRDVLCKPCESAKRTGKGRK